MKRLFILLLVILAMPLFSFSQEQVDSTAAAAEQARLDSINDRMRRDSLWAAWEHEYDSIKQVKVNFAKEMQEATKFLPRYKIYRTEFIRTLLKLDTRTGNVWIVLYSLSNDTESSEIPIEYYSLVDEDEGWNGRFELYPTKNSYNFIMVDNDDGTTYQVQWAIESEYRFIKKIKY